jgi:hypothetical protein
MEHIKKKRNIPSVQLGKYGMHLTSHQGCQMVYFQTKNPNLGKFWSVLQWKMLVDFVAVRSILWQFGIFCGRLVYFSRLGLFC